MPDHLVYKLTTVENPDVIQGLISISDLNDHVFVNLAESALFNQGKDKLYHLVGVHLFAFACKLAFDKGYEGFISFDSKSRLVEHYVKTLGAQRMGRSLRMFVNASSARNLVTLYTN